jgi:Zn-dependent protease with chaperone function
MWGFVALVAVTFFVLGGLALALPWRGVVALSERRPAESTQAAARYVALLVAPIGLLGLFVLSLLGPWDAAICQQLHDACLERISAWRLPGELGVALAIVAVISAGRLAKPYLSAGQALPRAALTPDLDAKWQRICSEINARCGTMPPLILVRSEQPVCHVRGLFAPRLYLSSALLETLDHDELVGAVTHEVAHLRRGDLPVGLLAYISHCLLFFMPSSRHCYGRYLEERELAADDWAVAHTGKPLALASALAKVGRAVPVSPRSVGYASGGPLLERRLERLLAPACSAMDAPRGRLALLLPVTLSLATAGSLMAMHLVLEAWGRGLLATLGVID